MTLTWLYVEGVCVYMCVPLYVCGHLYVHAVCLSVCAVCMCRVENWAQGLSRGCPPEKMSFSFMMLTSRLVRCTAAFSMICSGL